MAVAMTVAPAGPLTVIVTIAAAEGAGTVITLEPQPPIVYHVPQQPAA